LKPNRQRRIRESIALAITQRSGIRYGNRARAQKGKTGARARAGAEFIVEISRSSARPSFHAAFQAEFLRIPILRAAVIVLIRRASLHRVSLNINRWRARRGL